jgi:hypothetical protein
MIYLQRKEIYSIKTEARVNFKVTFKASGIAFKFRMKATSYLKPKEYKVTLKPARLLPPTVKAFDQLH